MFGQPNFRELQTALTLIRGILQEEAQETDDPVSDGLALLDWQYSEHATRHFVVEVLLVEFSIAFSKIVFLCLLSFLFLLRIDFIAALLMNLSEDHSKLPLRCCALLRITKDAADMRSEDRNGSLVWYLDGQSGRAR